MIRVCFYDTKPYDKAYFDKVLENYSNIEIDYFESKLNSRTAILAKGYDASVAFVNDDIGFKTIEGLDNAGVKLLLCGAQDLIMWILRQQKGGFVSFAYRHIHRMQWQNMPWRCC